MLLYTNLFSMDDEAASHEGLDLIEWFRLRVFGGGAAIDLATLHICIDTSSCV